jgi:hypothetical protein
MKQNEFLSAGALLLYALVALVLISLGISVTPTDPIKTTAITPQPSFDKRTVLPDGRVIISSSSEDLQAAHHNKTIDQFNRLLDGNG